MVRLTPASAWVRVNVFDTVSTSSTAVIVFSWVASPVDLGEAPELLVLVERVRRLAPGRDVADVLLGQDLRRLHAGLLLIDGHAERVAEHRVHHHVGRVDGVIAGPRQLLARLEGRDPGLVGGLADDLDLAREPGGRERGVEAG